MFLGLSFPSEGTLDWISLPKCILIFVQNASSLLLAMTNSSQCVSVDFPVLHF